MSLDRVYIAHSNTFPSLGLPSTIRVPVARPTSLLDNAFNQSTLNFQILSGISLQLAVMDILYHSIPCILIFTQE